MNPELSHDDVRAALPAEALDALDAGERAAVHAHLAGCEECRAELAKLRDAAALLGHAAPQREMDPARSARVRARLLARAGADREGASGDAGNGAIPITRASRWRLHPAWLAAAASVALLVATGANARSVRRDMLYHRGHHFHFEHEAAYLRNEVADRDRLLLALGQPDVRVIDLAAARPQAPSGRMFWDPQLDKWTFFASNLPQLRAGRDYQIWLITPTGPIGAGTFKPTAEGQALVEASYDLAPDQLRAVAITEEPEGGLPQPSGTPIIVGATE